MAENANLLSTPEGYATPDQIKSTYEYAKALMSGAGQQPVKHWTQGISNMVSALVGGNLDYQAGQKQKEADAVTAGRMLPAVPGGSGPLSTLGEAPASGGGAGGDASKAIAGIESGGNYASVGNVIPKTGDRAYGKYQVMGNNVPEWTQAVLGKSMTPAEFLKSPEAQEAVFKQKFGEYTQKYGPEGAAKAWFAGEAGMKNPNAHDPNGMTVANYAKKFTAAMGGPQGGATAFTGPDASQPPAVQAVTSALRGGEPAPQQLAASKGGSATPMPLPSGSGIFIDPSLVQRRPQYNEGQMRGILSDPKISERAKLGLLQQYNQQGQPIDVPYPGGIVRIDPNNPTHQQFIPEGHWGKKTLPGGLGYDIFQTPNGRGAVDVAPQGTPSVGPRSDAAPAVEPAAAPVGGPASGPAPVTATAPNAPAAPAVAPEGTPAAPVQVASLDPAAGVAQAAAAQAASGPPGAAVPGAPEVKVAQVDSPTPLARALGPNSKPPPGYSPDDWEAVTRYKKFENDAEVDKDAQVKGADAAAKKYDNLATQAQAGRKLATNIDLATSLAKDPRFHSGIFAGPQDIVARLKEGLFGDKFANAPNEAFDKLMAGTVLDTMKTALSGLGQVRLAEISLLTKANANRTNTLASNLAVLEISRRGLQSVDHLDAMGQQYASGDEVTDPISGKVLMKANVDKSGEIIPRHGLDVGFDKIVRRFTLDNPTFTPEQIKRYQTIFDTGVDPEAKADAPKAAGSLEETQPGMTYKGHTYKGGDKADPNNWEKPKAP